MIINSDEQKAEGLLQLVAVVWVKTFRPSELMIMLSKLTVLIHTYHSYIHISQITQHTLHTHTNAHIMFTLTNGGPARYSDPVPFIITASSLIVGI